MEKISNRNKYTSKELQALIDKYPYAAIYHIEYIKKAKESNKTLPKESLAKAALRVPSRSNLKDFLQIDKQKKEPKQQIVEAIALHSKEREIVVTEQREGKVLDEGVNKSEQKQEFHGFHDDNVEPIGKELVIEDESEEQILGNDSNKGDNKQKVDPAVEYDHDDYKVRLGLENLENDDVDEISEELVLTEEETAISDSKPVTEVSKTEQLETVADIEREKDESVYKKVVNILKQEQNDSVESNEQNHIVEANNTDGIEEIEHSDNDDALFYEQDFEADEELQSDSQEQSTTNDQYDDELETLYAQAAYEAEMSRKTNPSSNDNDGSETENNSETTENKPVNKEGEKDFMSWVSQYSSLPKMDDSKSQKKKVTEQQENKYAKSSKIEEEIELQYRDAEEDLDDEQTRAVQQLAQKSMVKNSGFYTETLASIYIKQEKWEDAIKVYKELARKNPEKSSYFANQIEKIKDKLN